MLSGYLTSQDKTWKSVQVFRLTGRLFYSLMALKEQADCAKAGPRLGTPHFPFEADSEALLICSEQS